MYGQSNQTEKQIRAIKDLRKTIPMNEYGLPTGVYRVDLLPFHDYDPDFVAQAETPLTPLLPVAHGGLAPIDGDSDDGNDGETTELVMIEDRVAGFRSQDLDCAFEPLSYFEGFPSFRNGDPFWMQFICEPPEAFMAFQRYLQMSSTLPSDMPQEALRGKQALLTGNASGSGERVAGATGFRSLALLAAYLMPDDTQLEAFQLQLREWAELYYWDWRAKAYDLFRVARHRQQQEIRAIETQDSHYFIARRLLAKIMNYVDKDEDFMDQMTPKVALDALKLVTTLERISAGLPAAGPLREGESTSTSMEFTMRRVAQAETAGTAQTVGDEQTEGLLVDEAGRVLTDALKNPEELRVMQEMILRFHATTNSGVH